MAAATAMAMAMATTMPTTTQAVAMATSCSSSSSLQPRTRIFTATPPRLRCNQIHFVSSISAISEGTKETRARNSSVVTTPFHLAIPVHDIHAAREFFGGVLGCPEGRSAKTWVDFNLFGHQVVCHEVRNYNASTSANAVVNLVFCGLDTLQELGGSIMNVMPSSTLETEGGGFKGLDGDPVPVPHFGLALTVPEFHALAERVRAAGVKFVIEPHIRFVGQPGEQWTMFFKDSSGNALEFKAMTTPSNLFAKYVVK